MSPGAGEAMTTSATPARKRHRSRHAVDLPARGQQIAGLHGREVKIGGLDDHGNSFETGSRATLPTDPGGVTGVLDYSGDRDYFWFQVSTSANVNVWSSGDIDTVGVLYDAFEVELNTTT